MKQKLSIVTFLAIIGAFLWVCTSQAIPPMPSSSYTGTGVANVTATNVMAATANVTNLNVSTAANVTGVTWTGLTVGSVSGAAATADLVEDLSTASHSIYKDATGNITNIITSINANATNTTITLIPGVCPVIHNTGMGDANVTSVLPASPDGKCFTGLITTAEDDKTWRLSSASANIICLGETCGKDDIGFATTEVDVGAMFKCIGVDTIWYCTNITGTADAGDL